MWVAVLAIGAIYIISTMLTPLYPLYRQQFGISELAVTEIYAVYVIGNLAVLFAFGRLSDQIGRRFTTLVAFVLTAASAACFLFASGIGGLFAARILNGFAAGLGAGALTAWIAELEPRKDKARAAVIASAGNLGGLAVGALVAGPLAQYGPWPLRLTFAIYMALLCVLGFNIRRVRETIVKPVRAFRALSLRPRIGVPRGIRLAFTAPACMAFTAFALGGFYAAVVPGMLGERLHESNVAVVGAVVGVFFGVACLTASLTRRIQGRTAMLSAAAFVLIGLSLLIAAEDESSMTLLLCASVVAGSAMACGYRGSLQIVNEIAPNDKRAEVISTFLLVCYTANSLPVLGVGVLSTLVGASVAHLSFAVAIAVVAVAATVIGVRFIPGGRRLNLSIHRPAP